MHHLQYAVTVNWNLNVNLRQFCSEKFYKHIKVPYASMPLLQCMKPLTLNRKWPAQTPRLLGLTAARPDTAGTRCHTHSLKPQTHCAAVHTAATEGGDVPQDRDLWSDQLQKNHKVSSAAQCVKHDAARIPWKSGFTSYELFLTGKKLTSSKVFLETWSCLENISSK